MDKVDAIDKYTYSTEKKIIKICKSIRIRFLIELDLETEKILEIFVK